MTIYDEAYNLLKEDKNSEAMGLLSDDQKKKIFLWHLLRESSWLDFWVGAGALLRASFPSIYDNYNDGKKVLTNLLTQDGQVEPA